jgi:hypothetical protein
MKRVVLRYGCIAGLILAVCMGATVPFMHHIPNELAMAIGYTTMVIAFLMAFYGVRDYRDSVGGGVISFGRGFGIALLITLLGSVFYVVAWEIINHFFMPDFMESYSAAVLEKARAGGATPEQLAAKAKELAEFAQMYKNPLFSAAMTLLEPLPVAVLMSLAAAAILRRREPVAA